MSCAEPLTRRTAVAALLSAVLVIAGCSDRGQRPSDARSAGSPPEGARSVPCNLWNAIGDTPTDAELDAAAGRYDVVILNPWETDALARLRAADPDITVLAYRDFSSTRSYAVIDGRDADILPTGVGFVEAEQAGRDWFAFDSAERRIEWRTYDDHWQMAVWNPDYRARWTQNVVADTVENGWDGVFADNDFARLRFYSPVVLSGTANTTETDQLIRDGLDDLVTEAGTELRDAGKLLIPNVSEARLFPGRWEQHTRFGGGMEEHFAYFDSEAGGEFLTDTDPTGWLAQTAQVALPDRLSLVITRSAPDDLHAQRYGYASAAVRGAGQVCWAVNTVGAYDTPEWSTYQDIPLGEPLGPPVRGESGVWTREFQGGWVAVNPTTSAARVEVPDAIEGAGGMDLPATDAMLRVRT